MEHRVVVYSGSTYADEPREFFLGDEHHRVREVIACRLEETPGLEGMTRKVWRVADHGGEEYRLTYYLDSDFWEIERSNSGRI
jgi:hypothetical protein